MGDEQDLWHVIALRASSAPDPAPDRWLSNVFPSTNEKSSLSSSLVLILIVSTQTRQSCKHKPSRDPNCDKPFWTLSLQAKDFNVKADGWKYWFWPRFDLIEKLSYPLNSTTQPMVFGYFASTIMKLHQMPVEIKCVISASCPWAQGFQPKWK